MRRFVLFFFVATIGGVWFLWNNFFHERYARFLLERERSAIQEMIPVSFIPPPETISLSSEDLFLQTLPSDLPDNFLLDVPFVCQNPFRDESGWKWHEESCEEAAALQAVLFFQKKTLSPDEAHLQILDMIAWQEDRFQGHRDLFGEEMRLFLRDFFSLQEDEVFFLPEIDEPLLKSLLVSGIPVILPVASDLLKNPFYPHPGYHMVTLVGYRGEVSLVHDVGTRRGERFPYPFSRLLAANQGGGGGAFIIRPVTDIPALR